MILLTPVARAGADMKLAGWQMADRGESGWSPEEVVEISERQKMVLWLLLAQVTCMVMVTISKLVGDDGDLSSGITLAIHAAKISLMMFCILGVYKMARSLRKEHAVIYAAAMFFPLIGPLVLFVINGEATRAMESGGVRVFMQSCSVIT